jgi:phosphoglycerol transferase MdoB-like AlkP superfamily enzyme
MPSVILIILSLIDIATGALIYHQSFSLFPAIFYYSAYFHLIKGGFSWMGAIAEKSLFEWMGTVDFLAGVAALMISFNFSSSFFPVIGIVLAIKGLYALVLSMF